MGKNLVEEGQLGAPILLTAFNYARGFAEGIELTTSYDIDQWSLYANFAVSKAMGEHIISSQFNFSPDDLAFIANHFIHLDHDQTYTASVGVAYTIPSPKTKLPANVIFRTGLRSHAPTTPHAASFSHPAHHNLRLL